MAKVRKRVLPSGRETWLVDYRDGMGHRRFRQFQTRKAADSFLLRARVEVRDGLHTPDATAITVREAADLFITRCETEGLRESTIRGYRQHIDLAIVPKFGAIKLSRLTTPAIEAWKDELLRTRSRAMARRILTTFKAILAEARRRGLVAQNVATGVRVKKQAGDRHRIEIPTKAELNLMLERVEQAGGPRWRPFLITAIFTGLRQSELRALRWENVDLNAGVIRVCERADFRKRVGPPKSDAGHRDVPIGPFVANTLRAWRLASPSDATLVFPTSRDTIYGMSKVHHQFWWPLMASCGLLEPGGRPKYRFHDLRHCAASAWIAAGVTPKRIQTLMGHASIQMTFDVYGHLFADAEKDREDAAKVEARLLA